MFFHMNYFCYCEQFFVDLSACNYYLINIILISFLLKQADFDLLLVNLRMDATYIKEGMNINWVSEVRNIQVTIISL